MYGGMSNDSKKSTQQKMHTYEEKWRYMGPVVTNQLSVGFV